MNVLLLKFFILNAFWLKLEHQKRRKLRYIDLVVILFREGTFPGIGLYRFDQRSIEMNRTSNSLSRRCLSPPNRIGCLNDTVCLTCVNRFTKEKF